MERNFLFHKVSWRERGVPRGNHVFLLYQNMSIIYNVLQIAKENKNHY